MTKKKTFIHWKGRTLSEITPIIIKNVRTGMGPDKHLLFKQLPLIHYRKEICDASTGSSCSENIIMINSNHNHCESCVLTNKSPSTDNSAYIKSLSEGDNALRRVRSAGMSRPRYDPEMNNRPQNYRSSSQYLYGRNRTFKQNQFNHLRIENTDGEKVYSSNTIQFCNNTTTSSNGESNYVPVYYKPNNTKFAVQGAVDASARLAQLKYDTITDAGAKMQVAYGPHTANALAYGVPENGYTIKDKIGYPNICTPVIKKDGTMVRC